MGVLGNPRGDSVGISQKTRRCGAGRVLESQIRQVLDTQATKLLVEL